MTYFIIWSDPQGSLFFLLDVFEREGSAGQAIHQLLARVAPNLLQRATVAEGAIIRVYGTFVQRDRPVDGFDHVQYRNFRGWPGQRNAAARAARGLDQAGQRELRNDFR